MSGNSDRAAWQVTTDREQILQWADEHDAVPLRAEETGGNDLRLLSDPAAGRGERLSWEAFFERFEERSLALRYRETATRGEGQPAYEFVDRREISTEETDHEETPDGVEVHTAEDDERDDVGNEEPGPPGTEGSGVTQVDSETAAGTSEAKRDETVSVSETEEDEGATDRDTDTAMSESAHGAEVGAFVLDEIHEEHGLTDNIGDEYVVFENTAERALDISGWRVENDDGQRFVFPDDTVLDPGQAVTLHSERGADAETDFYWGATDPVWDDDGDTIRVRTADGREVLEEPYGK